MTPAQKRISNSDFIIIERKFREIFPFNVIVVFCKKGFFNAVDKLSRFDKYKELQNTNVDSLEGVKAFVICREDTGNNYLFIDKTISLDTIVHEIVHIVFSITDRLGLIHDENSEEAFAYLSDSIFRHVYEVCKKDLKININRLSSLYGK